MAVIGKIRKNFWFVLLVLGLALAAFILMDMSGSSGPGGQVTNLTMGNVAGEKISYQDFQTTESAYYRNANLDVYQKRKNIWDFYVEEALVNKEASALGLNVPYDELMELQFGTNQSSVIINNWTNPQTGQVDLAQLNQFRTMIEGGNDLPPDLEAFWGEQEKHIIKDALQNKIFTLVNKSIYTPSWMAEESYKNENTKVDFSFVKIPFDAMDGEGVELTDADFVNFMKENKALYEEDEPTRIAEYATFEVVPSESDKQAIREQMDLLRNEFLVTEDDSLFAVSNRGGYSHIYYGLDQLPESARDSIASLTPGQVYGPYEDQGAYGIIKLLDKRVVPDTVEAKHIIINANRADASSVAAAQAKIDSIEQVYKSGSKSFEDLAKEHSQGPSGPEGGDLGRFTQASMVKEFSDVCFMTGKAGGVYKTVTDFGVHLIRVEDQVFNDEEPKYQIATIAQVIIPSQQTQDAMFDKVSDIVAVNRNMSDMTAALEAENIRFEKSAPLKANDFSIGTLGSGQTTRDMVLWLFDSSTDVGGISPNVYRFTDRVNYYDNKYVILGLSQVVPAGLKTVDSVRDQLETALLNKKKAEKLAASLNVSSLDAVASQFNVEVQEATDISLTSTFVPGAGNEPEVIGTAFALAPQSVSKAIVGNSGVFVLSPRSVQPSSAPNNIPFLKNSLATTTRSQVNFKILENLKERANIEDQRSKFF